MKNKAGYIVLIIMFFALTGCGTIGMTTTIIKRGDGKDQKIVCVIISKSDALVEYKEGDVVCKVDNRGSPSTLERIIEYGMTKPRINIGGEN